MWVKCYDDYLGKRLVKFICSHFYTKEDNNDQTMDNCAKFCMSSHYLGKHNQTGSCICLAHQIGPLWGEVA